MLALLSRGSEGRCALAGCPVSDSWVQQNRSVTQRQPGLPSTYVSICWKSNQHRNLNECFPTTPKNQYYNRNKRASRSQKKIKIKRTQYRTCVCAWVTEWSLVCVASMCEHVYVDLRYPKCIQINLQHMRSSVHKHKITECFVNILFAFMIMGM